MMDDVQPHQPANSRVVRFFRSFVDHPASVDETYFEHMRFAFGFAGTMMAAGLAALIHAFIPPLFETTASRLVRKMNARLEARH